MKKESVLDLKKLTLAQRNKVIVEYTPLIRFVARRICRKLPPNVEVDDLVSCGFIGLMDALEKYDPKKDIQFKTYAEFRIRGAILDELRSQDWVPRSIRDKKKRLDRLTRDLCNKLGRQPRSSEVADALGFDGGEFYKFLYKTSTSSLVSLDDFAKPVNRDVFLEISKENTEVNPQKNILNNQVNRSLHNSIVQLTGKEQFILKGYYFEGMTLRSISKSLDLTESRISQLHIEALKKMRKILKAKSYIVVDMEEKDAA